MIFLFSCNNAEDKSIDQFFGQYNLEDDCILIPSTGVITTISAIENEENKIEMDHFGPGGRTVPATVSGNSLTIDHSNEDVEYWGSGSINDQGNIITITYSYSQDIITNEDCTVILTRL